MIVANIGAPTVIQRFLLTKYASGQRRIQGANANANGAANGLPTVLWLLALI